MSLTSLIFPKSYSSKSTFEFANAGSQQSYIGRFYAMNKYDAAVYINPTYADDLNLASNDFFYVDTEIDDSSYTKCPLVTPSIIAKSIILKGFQDDTIDEELNIIELDDFLVSIGVKRKIIDGILIASLENIPMSVKHNYLSESEINYLIELEDSIDNDILDVIPDDLFD